jgi:hypothetical protein
MSYTISKLQNSAVGESDNIRFKFHFLLREMQKGIRAIRDCKKETREFKRREKMNK